MLKQLAEERNVAFLSLSPESPFEDNTKKTRFTQLQKTRQESPIFVYFLDITQFLYYHISASFAKKYPSLPYGFVIKTKMTL